MSENENEPLNPPEDGPGDADRTRLATTGSLDKVKSLFGGVGESLAGVAGTVVGGVGAAAERAKAVGGVVGAAAGESAGAVALAASSAVDKAKEASGSVTAAAGERAEAVLSRARHGALEATDSVRARGAGFRHRISSTIIGTGVFGVDLAETVRRAPGIDHPHVPFVLEVCCSFLESTGKIHKNLFQVPAAIGEQATAVESLKLAFDSESGLADAPEALAHLKDTSAEIVAQLLTAFFLELPEPLILSSMQDELLGSAESGLTAIIARLPVANMEVLRFMVAFAHRMSSDSGTTGHTSKVFAIAFGPLWFRRKTLQVQLADMGGVVALTDNLIRNNSFLFTQAARFRAEAAAREPAEVAAPVEADGGADAAIDGADAGADSSAPEPEA